MSDPENVVPTDAWPPEGENVPTPPSFGSPPVPSAETLPAKVGRFRVVRLLGEGGFGQVYLAQDDQLGRPVALKVPHRRVVVSPVDALAYLAEARTVANLDHPHIVPVFDVGSTAECPFYIVSKYIAGKTLAQRIRQDRPAAAESAELVATVAEALHYAHRQGLVHRDVKPGNILLDADGKPYVADFGLALREADLGKGPGFAGTPVYMSPEQVRGEGHRVDGRSDVFSLGVVFYELLTGRRPFQGESTEKLLEYITTFEPRPPRQHDDTIPKELERVCLKALAKRASERYTTAKDLADDLRHFLAAAPDAVKSTRSRQVPSDAPAAATLPPGPEPTPTPDSRPVRIVPKGLRSFDAHDADFFLELLPGPRDRDGLPDGLRFWKRRVEEPDPDQTFSVGLIYGPSGCGKSSLVKAGLLPRLSERVLAVYVEATADDTEARLLNGMRKRCPALPAHLGLKETLTALRRGQGLPAGQKVLLVLDQFEQWLHAHRAEADAELVQALRQCDGGRVQCVVLVRDDFWMAATRFMRDLEVRLVEGHNSAAVDLFPQRHAEKVLAAFGRAFGALPDGPGEVGKDQKQFLEQAVAGLAEDGKVICVRLALFAEMMKGKPWTLATLKAVGGAAGVGATFLEETFSAATAPPEHRYHQKAARAVLKALLPESGTDIKGGLRSHTALLEASGYVGRAREFDELIRILDGEVRLITPTDPEGKEDTDVAAFARTREASTPHSGECGYTDLEGKEDTEPSTPHSGECGYYTRYYQLTHDYLVPSLRDWLTRKQKETRRGRAELLLADRAAVWSARPENRQLPSVLQWLSIRSLTRKKDWTAPQRHMMRRATRFHVLRGLVFAAFMALAGWGGYEGYGTLRAHSLRDQLLKADTTKVPAIVEEMASSRRWIDPLLRDAYREAEANQDGRKQLHASLALLPEDAGQVDYLCDRLLATQPHEVPVLLVLRDALQPHKDALLDRLWAAVEQPVKGGQESQRLRGAGALASYDADSPRWRKVQNQLANDLVGMPAVYLATWKDALRPIGTKLQAPLEAIYREGKRRETERSLATEILADYASAQPKVLANLLMDADDKQFAVLYPKLKNSGDSALKSLQNEVDRKPAPDATNDDKDKLAKRRANAAVALLRLGQPGQVWPMLKHSPDPSARSYLIHRLGPMGADARTIVRRIDEEPDVPIRRALLLSLGEFGEGALSPGERDTLVKRLQEMYWTEDDPGLHAAAEWLLRHGKQDRWLHEEDAAWAADKLRRKERLLHVYKALAKGQEAAKPQWYVTGQGQTMVVLPGPVEFKMGSPLTEAGRNTDEHLHKVRIGRTFAVAAKAVTVEQFLKFRKSHEKILLKRYTPTGDCPVNGETWFEAAEYCNWLSEKEGLPEEQWCYETDAAGRVTKLRKGYLGLPGYHLPTEAEIEYACRAGAATARYYGETDELLAKYAWYLGNSAERTWPVGSLKPNDLGLFDAHGNVWCWCQEKYLADPQSRGGKAIEDIEDKQSINSIKTQESRVLRGGAFLNRASLVRSAQRVWLVPADRADFIGFRPARTLPLNGLTALQPVGGDSAPK